MQRTKKIIYWIIGSILFFIVLCLVLIFIFLFPFVDRENQLALQIPKNVSMQIQKRQETYVEVNKISNFVKEAAIASQDKRFYSNFGIDILANLRALFFLIVTRHKQGASTITEQLAKNVYYQDKDTLYTDIQTKILALFITLHFSKEKILEMYFNDIYYGNSAYGIQQAADVYFKTTPEKLSLEQSAYLIALINAPSYLSLHTKQAYNETKIILQEMVKNGYITNKQEQDSLTYINAFLSK